MWSQVSQSLHESMARVISRIATLLPGILAFILAVLFFAAIAWVLAWLVRTLLNAIRIDERLARARNLSDELSLLTNSGERIAQRIERSAIPDRTKQAAQSSVLANRLDALRPAMGNVR